MHIPFSILLPLLVSAFFVGIFVGPERVLRLWPVRRAKTRHLLPYCCMPYTKVLKLDEEGDVVATVKELPGCTTHGKTEYEAIDNLNELMAIWITDALEKGHPVPEPKYD